LLVKTHQLAARDQFAAGCDDVDTALAPAVGLFQKSALGVVEIPRPAVDGQGDKLLLDQANNRLGPVGRRTAAGTGASANSDGCAPRPAPDQDRFAFRRRLLAGFPDVDEPGDLMETQFARLWLDQGVQAE
jgi:hypothetical protein